MPGEGAGESGDGGRNPLIPGDDGLDGPLFGWEDFGEEGFFAATHSRPLSHGLGARPPAVPLTTEPPVGYTRRLWAWVLPGLGSTMEEKEPMSRRNIFRPLGVVLIAFALIAVACGDDDEGSTFTPGALGYIEVAAGAPIEIRTCRRSRAMWRSWAPTGNARH